MLVLSRRIGEEVVIGRNVRLTILAVHGSTVRVGITAPPMFHRIFRWPQAMPQYTLGHLDRLAAIEKRLALHPG